ncbi:uncharacterized protein LOC126696947 [Quercus robur]|uniref:uncharacterized protein LOC126696947 n=1 Tax=Quercus robur TaxID=38942 RepID=UPI0021630054|nr:uncharacterized protein LOC126696947 [Quercus robur]
MGGDPTKCNQSLHCQYHQEQGHTTKDCRTLRSHLEQLVTAGKLKQFLYQPKGQGDQARLGALRDAFTRTPLGTISVILTVLGSTGFQSSKVMFEARPSVDDSYPDPKRSRMGVRPTLSFLDDDKIGTLQLHNDALVVTIRIGGYDVKRVLVDQGSNTEIMYPNLYKGLKLRSEDLTYFDSLLIGFDRKVVFPKGQIQLLIQTGTKVVEVNFIVVDTYSPYTAIVARPWVHAMRAVPSTLHLKVKYPSGNWVKELVGSQFMAKQCMVAAIRHQTGGRSSASIGRDL